MKKIIDIVRQEVDQYAGLSLNTTLYPVFDEERHVYTVISVGKPAEKYPARAVIMARIVNNQVIIEADITDKPLVDALKQAGIPREQIVLAYAGE